LTATHSIIASNTGAAVQQIINYNGTFTRIGVNIMQDFENGGSGSDSGPAAIAADPLVSALNNGGPTQTMAIANTSPARNAVVGSTITTDQRGLPVVSTPDIGAFEMQGGGTFTINVGGQHDSTLRGRRGGDRD
jgi:hypothetical protein